MPIKKMQDLDLTGKTVVIREDLNVPMVGVGKLEGGAVQGLLLAAGATVAFSAGAVLFRGKYSNMVRGRKFVHTG